MAADANVVDNTVAAATPKRPRRGAKFWLTIALAIVIALPVLLFLGAVAYIRLGGLRSTVTAEIADVFGSSTKVDAVTTRWLDNLNIDNIQIQPAESGKPLTVDRVHLDWDYGPMFFSGRMRSLQVDNPKVDLKRLANGRWNFEFKPTKQPESEGRIEQILINGGEFSLEFLPGAPIQLSNLTGALSNTGAPAPCAYSLRGVLPSAETFNISGSIGPGPALVANFFGAAIVEKDWPPAMPLKGKLSYDLALRREALPDNPKSAGPLQLDGRIDLGALHWLLDSGKSFSIGERSLHVRTAFPTPGHPTQTVLLDTKLGIDGLANVSIGKMTSDDKEFALENGAGRIDIGAISALRRGADAGDGKEAAIQANVEFSGVSASIPQIAGEASKMKIAGDAIVHDARIAIPLYGDLPALSATMKLNWPALPQASISAGAAMHATFSAADLTPALTEPPQAAALAIIAKSVVQDLSIDLGEVLRWDVIRRLASGTKTPTAADLPYLFDGMLTASQLTPEIKRDGNDTTVVIRGMKLRDLMLRRWPLRTPVPALLISGELTATARCGASGTSVSLEGRFAENEAKAKGLAGEFHIAFTPDEKGAWRPGPLRLTNVACPLATLNRIIDVSAISGITGDAQLSIAEAAIDTATRTITATVTIDAPVLNIPFPETMQAALAAGLRGTGLTAPAVVLEHYPIDAFKLTGGSATVGVTIADGRMTLHGKTKKTAANIHTPAPHPFDEVSLFSFPEYEFTYTQPVEPDDGDQRFTFELHWSNEGQLALEVVEPPSGALKTAGKLHLEAAGGKSIAFELATDLHNHRVGPLVASIDSINGADFNALHRAFNWRGESSETAYTGGIRNVKVELPEVSLRTLTVERKIGGKLTATLDHFGLRSGEWDEIAGSGPVVCVANYAGGALNLNTLVTLQDYNALFCDGHCFIPSPQQGRSGSFKTACTLSQKSGEEKLIRLRIDNCDLNLPGVLVASLSGIVNCDGAGKLKDAKFDNLRVSTSDLHETWRTLAAANASDPERTAVSDANGNASFAGQFSADASDNWSLAGAAKIRDGSLDFGAALPLSITGINGDIPLIVRGGAWPEDAKTAAETGALYIGAMESGTAQTKAQKLAVSAMPNAFSAPSPLDINTPLGSATLSNLVARDIFKTGLAGPGVSFGAAVKIDAGKIVQGLDNCILAGPLQFEMKPDALSGDWALDATGALKGPFGNGTLNADNIRIRGLLGSAPVFSAELSADRRNAARLNEVFHRGGAAGSNFRADVSLNSAAPDAPFDVEAASPPASPALDLNVQTAEIQKIRGRIDARALKLEALKNSGAVGENANGKIESRTGNAEASISKRKEIHDLIALENDDRSALFREILLANGLPATELPQAAAAYAAKRRDAAAPGQWIKSSGLWVLKKNLAP